MIGGGEIRRLEPRAHAPPIFCPSAATAGEKRTFALLRDRLPGHFTACYEPVVAGRYPDFCPIAEDFGLLMLEVKGWYAGQVARDNDHEIELRKSEGEQTRVEVHNHPIVRSASISSAWWTSWTAPSTPSSSASRASPGTGRV